MRAEREKRRRRILFLIAMVKPGHVISYRDLSIKVYGHPRGAQAIGNVIRATFQEGGCFGWYRVVCADGTLSPYAPSDQRKRLEADGMVFEGEGVGARIKSGSAEFPSSR